MGRMSRRRVAVQELAWHCQEYPYVFRSVSGIQFWWIFRNGSGMVPEAFHVSPEDIFAEDPISNALRARIGVALSVVLSSYSGGAFKCFEGYVGFLRNIFVGFRKIYVYVPDRVAGQSQYL